MKSTIAVTGCSRGIGQAIATHFLQQGWRVLGVDRSDKPVGEDFLKADLSTERGCGQFCQFVESRTDHLDVLVNNAGTMVRKPPEQLDILEWNRVLALNLTAPFLLTRGLAGVLRKGRGRVINMCSTRAHMSEPNTEAYSASKGGLLALTHALAVSLGPEIKVNAVSPGWIHTTDDELSAADHSQHPAGRVGKTQDVVELVKFLAGKDNSFVTGAEFVVDGGMTRKMIYTE